MIPQTELTFLREAELIGEKICRKTLWSDDQCYWEDNFLGLDGDKEVILRRPVGIDLYFGAPGIALFLAALYSVAPNNLYRTVAESSANLTLTQIEALDPRFPIGFYVGYLGTAYSLMKLGETFANEQFTSSALQLIHLVGERDVTSQGFDIISGAAGVIPVLLNVYRKYSDDSVLNLAVKYGDHLISSRVRTSQIGFAHGDAGIAWSLLELSAVSGEKRFLTAAEESFQYQRTHLDLLRETLSWCNGAVGVCFSRLRAYEVTGKQIYKDECEDILSTAIRYDTSDQNYSLCHGIAGTADLLVYASKVFNDINYKNAADQKGLEGIERIEQKGLPWPCGSSFLGETLNLMSGLAGIGYFYLRLYDPEKIPPLTIVLPEIC